MVSGGAAGKRGNGDMLNRPPEIDNNMKLTFSCSLPFGSFKGINDFFRRSRFLYNVRGKITWAIFPFYNRFCVRRTKFSCIELLNSITPNATFINGITFTSIITTATLLHKNTFYTVF